MVPCIRLEYSPFCTIAFALLTWGDRNGDRNGDGPALLRPSGCSALVRFALPASGGYMIADGNLPIAMDGDAGGA